MTKTIRTAFLSFAICALVAYAAGPCSALVIDLVFDTSLQDREVVQTGVRQAADMWEAVLVDPVTLQIDIRRAPVWETGFNIAMTYTTVYGCTLPEIRDALVTDAKSVDDQTAVSHLPAGTRLTFHTLDPQGNRIINTGNDLINNQLNVPQATVKALGLEVEPDLSDAEILLSEFFLDGSTFDFDSSDGVQGMDFVSLVAHEIGHVLGFSSGVDVVDETSLPNGPDAPEDISDYVVFQVLDLFRYTTESLPLTDFAPGGSPYFSIDGGTTNLGPFSSGIFNGDGGQAGHWVEGQGILDALLPYNTVTEISSLDLRALDVIGWDLVPEPTTLNMALMCVTGLFIGANRRRSNRN